MAGPPRALALDIGTSSTRALLFDPAGNPVPGAEVHLTYERRVLADGTAEVDPEKLLGAVVTSVDDLRRQTGGSLEVEAVGISSFWHGVLAVDRHAQPASPLLLWSDSRSAPVAQRLAVELDAEAVRQRTGCPVHATYWPAKVSWLRDQQPRLRAPGTVWLSFADFLGARLFGPAVTSVSMASGTGLLLVREGGWDGQLLERLGLEPTSLPALGETLRGLRPEFARRWPELAEVPWSTARGDGALANLGSGCLDPSARSITIGTSGALRVMSPHIPDRIPTGLFCYRLDRTTAVAGAASSNGGNLHAWALRTLRGDERELTATAAAMAPGEHGLTFLPLLAGERSLGFAPHATGAMAGLTLATSPGAILRAALEGVAVEFAAYNARLNEAWPRPRRLVGSGAGLLRSPLWMQMLADATGHPLEASRAAEASSRGAAIVALAAVGAWDAAHADPGAAHVYRPDPAAAPAYAELGRRLDAMYDGLRDHGFWQAPAPGAHYEEGREGGAHEQGD